MCSREDCNVPETGPFWPTFNTIGAIWLGSTEVYLINLALNLIVSITETFCTMVLYIKYL